VFTGTFSGYQPICSPVDLRHFGKLLLLRKVVFCPNSNVFGRVGNFPVFLSREVVLGVFAKLRNANVSFVMSLCLSVCPCEATRLPLDGLPWNLIFFGLSKICPQKFTLHENLTRIVGAIDADLCTCMTIFRWIFLRTRNISDKLVGIKTHILCSGTFFRKSYHLKDNVEIYTRTRNTTIDNIIWCMRFTCRITKVTGTHSKYVTRSAIPRPKLLRESFHSL